MQAFKIRGITVKKLTALTLIATLQLSLSLPLFALESADNTEAKLKTSVSKIKEKPQKTKKERKISKREIKKQAKELAKQQEILKSKITYINTDWWESFQDPILSSYIERALQKNHDLKIATISTDEYYQNYKIQFGKELPQITAGFMPNLIKMPGSSDSYGMFALPGIVSYEADIFLKNRDKTKSVQKQYEASIIDERAVYISIASAVGTAYFNTIRLDKAVELQKEINKQRREIYELMLLSNKEGLVSASDTIKANKALVNGQAELIELKKQREKILNQLAVLIGESPEGIDSLARTPLDELFVTNRVPASISSEVIENRPDYLKAEKMVEKAGLDVRIAKKELLPTINLNGMAFFNNGSLGSLFTTKSMLWALGGAALLPLFTGGQKMGNLRLKKAQYERILQTYLKTNLVAIQEINDAMVSARLDWDKLGQTLEQQALEQKDYSYNEMKYNHGVISKLDLIQFRENLLTIDMLVAQQKAEYLVDYIGLYKACGAQI